MLTTLLVGLAACTVNPVTGRKELDLMGEAQEAQLGSQLYPRYTQMSLGEVPDPRLQTYVEAVGEKLAEVSHRPQLQYHFNAVNDPVVNAYALPGGKISITRGLLARLDNEDELAAVLGHETGHVCARHAARQYTQAMVLQAALVGSAVYMESRGTKHRDVYVLGGLLGASLWTAHYSRQQERQADGLGFEYMIRAGYSPNGMVEVMEVLKRTNERAPGLLERMFASHPMSSERVETARQRVAKVPADVRSRPEVVRPYRDATKLVRTTRDSYDQLARGRRLLAEKKVVEAVAVLRTAADATVGDPLPRAFLAAAELQSGGTQGALRDAERVAAEAVGENIFYVQAITGEVFLEGGRFEDALLHLNAAKALLPDQAEVELLRGKALESLGRRSEAQAAYERVKKLAPDTALAREAESHLREL